MKKIKGGFDQANKTLGEKLKRKMDLQVLCYLWKNNNLFFKTKLEFMHFEDVLVQALWKLTAKNINQKGRFFPASDLQELIEDEERMERYKQVGYPLEINEVDDIINYIYRYETDDTFLSLERSIRSRWTRSRLKKVNTKLTEDIADSSVSAKEILRKYSNDLDNLMYSNDEDRIVLSTREMYEDEIAFQNSDTEDEHYPTGISIIDQVNGGLNSPSFTCIAGAAKSGKSIGLYQTVLASLMQGKSVVLGTIEIPPAEAKRKLYSLYTGIEYQKISKKILDDEERELYLKGIAEFTDKFDDLLFIYYQKSGFAAKDIENYVSNLEKGGINIQNIVLDYMLIMKSNDDVRGVGGIEFMTKIPKELRILSMKTDTRVFSAAQLHSRTQDKTIEQITFDDIYYMKNVAHEATYLTAISVEDGKLLSRVLLARQKWGPEVYIYPNYDYGRIYTGEAELYENASYSDWG